MQALRDYVTAADGYRYANQVSLLHCKIQVLTGCPSQRQAALDLGNSAGCEHIAAGRHTLQSDSEMAWPCFRQQHDSTALRVRKHQKARMLEFLATTKCKMIEMQNVQHDAVTCHCLSPSKGWPSQREAGALGPWALGILEAELGHHRAPSLPVLPVKSSPAYWGCTSMAALQQSTRTRFEDANLWRQWQTWLQYFNIFQYVADVAVDCWTYWALSTGSDRPVWCECECRSSTWDEAVATPCSSGTMLVVLQTLRQTINWYITDI